MSRLVLLRLLPLLACLPVLAGGAERWADVKPGMSADETTTALGRPLIRNGGKGFELWIYDQGAEVVFYGGVIAWTVPAGSKVPNSANEAWTFYQAAPDQVALPFPKQRFFLPVPALRPKDTGVAASYRFARKT